MLINELNNVSKSNPLRLAYRPLKVSKNRTEASQTISSRARLVFQLTPDL